MRDLAPLENGVHQVRAVVQANFAALTRLVSDSARELVLLKKLAARIKIVHRPSDVVVLVSRNVPEIVRSITNCRVSRIGIALVAIAAATEHVTNSATGEKKVDLIGPWHMVHFFVFFLSFASPSDVADAVVGKRERRKTRDMQLTKKYQPV